MLELKSYLAKHNIECKVSASENFYHTKEVNDIFNLLIFLQKPKDRYYKAAALRSNILRYSDNEIYQIISKDLDVEELKTLFEIPNSYLYKDIRVNVIDKAKQQFKEKTNITFDYEEYKIGRAVKRLKITVKENNKGSNDIFANKKSFINHIRKEYIPNPDKNHFPIIVSTKQGDVKINITGEIYLSGDTVVNYDNKQADKLWDWLFDLVKNKPELLKNPNEKNLLN